MHFYITSDYAIIVMQKTTNFWEWDDVSQALYQGFAPGPH